MNLFIKYIKKSICFLFYIIICFPTCVTAQYEIKNSVDFVLLYENDVVVDTIMGKFGNILEYKISNDSTILIITDLDGDYYYSHMNLNNGIWRSTTSSGFIHSSRQGRFMPEELREQYEGFSFKITDVDVVEKWKNSKFVEYVDIDFIRTTNTNFRHKMDSMYQRSLIEKTKQK